MPVVSVEGFVTNHPVVSLSVVDIDNECPTFSPDNILVESVTPPLGLGKPVNIIVSVDGTVASVIFVSLTKQISFLTRYCTLLADVVTI